MSFLELHFLETGEGENGIEFQRTKVCLNEFPAPLMWRGGRASKRGGIDSEIMLVCVFVCVLKHRCMWQLWGQSSKTVLKANRGRGGGG